MLRWLAHAGAALGLGLVVVPSSVWALGETAAVELKDASGQAVGTVAMIETMAGVLINVQLKGLQPGLHAIHVHSVGQCEGDFASAGPIYNPFGAQHGFKNPEGPMAGDLPNITVGADGTGAAELLSPSLTLNQDAEDTMLDADGASVIVFEKADDHMTEPEGNAGLRIACGVIGKN